MLNPASARNAVRHRAGRARAGAAVLTAMLLAACGYVPFLGTDTPPPTQGPQADQYQRAIAYKEKSDCPHAIPLLEPLAKRGHGFEVAQFELGQCYLAVARSTTSAGDARQARDSGAQWILKAADSRVPGAQQEAIRLYEDGIGVEADPVEAGKWLLLLKRNPMRRVFGPAVIDPDLEQGLQKRLTAEQWAAAQRRAESWQPVEQPTIVPAPADDKKTRESER